MKNSKLNLKSLKVQSFITDIDNVAEQTVKGGRPDTEYRACNISIIYICKWTFHTCRITR